MLSSYCRRTHHQAPPRGIPRASSSPSISSALRTTPTRPPLARTAAITDCCGFDNSPAGVLISTMCAMPWAARTGPAHLRQCHARCVRQAQCLHSWRGPRSTTPRHRATPCLAVRSPAAMHRRSAAAADAQNALHETSVYPAERHPLGAIVLTPHSAIANRTAAGFWWFQEVPKRAWRGLLMVLATALLRQLHSHIVDLERFSNGRRAGLAPAGSGSCERASCRVPSKHHDHPPCRWKIAATDCSALVDTATRVDSGAIG